MSKSKIHPYTTDTEQVVCPYCDHVELDDDYFTFFEDGVFECGKCEREFFVSQHIKVTYTSQPMKDSCQEIKATSGRVIQTITKESEL